MAACAPISVSTTYEPDTAWTANLEVCVCAQAAYRNSFRNPMRYDEPRYDEAGSGIQLEISSKLSTTREW